MSVPCYAAGMSEQGLSEERAVGEQEIAALRELLTEDEAFRRFMRQLMSSGEESLRALEGAVASGDAAATERAAHRLKGAFANVGAAPLVSLCARLEAEARDGRAERLGPLQAEARRELGRVGASVAALLAARAEGA